MGGYHCRLYKKVMQGHEEDVVEIWGLREVSLAPCILTVERQIIIHVLPINYSWAANHMELVLEIAWLLCFPKKTMKVCGMPLSFLCIRDTEVVMAPFILLMLVSLFISFYHLGVIMALLKVCGKPSIYI